MTSNMKKWTSSWHNFHREVTDQLDFPEKIQIEDWTLQGDGEETPGVTFTSEEAIAIARKLDEIGIPRIIAGLIEPPYPADADIVRKIAHLGLNAKIGTIASLTKSDLDRVSKYDASWVDIGTQTSDFWLDEKSMKLSREKILTQAVDVTTYANDHGVKVTFNLRDAARADEQFLKQLIQTLSEQPAVETLRITEPYGLASPHGFTHLVCMIKRWSRLPIALHCHNDFGLSTANVIMGLSSGASIVNTTVNGIGERCGLTSLEEVAVALRILYNIDVGVKYDKLCELSKLVEDATGPLISKLKPIVGERAFAWETDGYIPGKGTVRVPYEPDFVGNDFRFYPGKKTGTDAIKWHTERMKLNLTYNQLAELCSKIRERSMSKNPMTGEEFSRLLHSLD